ncbi:hypothetical protein AC1031_008488 [Aphanomyces cochlioides]|nr:hypothetical protein AC1031_008488 [Aphanomyces cochlioides]
MRSKTGSPEDDEVAAAALARQLQKKRATQACASTSARAISTQRTNSGHRPKSASIRRRSLYIPDARGPTSDQLHVQFPRQVRQISQAILHIYSTPGPGDYENNRAVALTRPHSARASLIGGERRESKISDTPPSTIYNPKLVGRRAPSTHITLTRPPEESIAHDHRRFFVPESDFDFAKRQSWSTARRISTGTFSPARPKSASTPSNNNNAGGQDRRRSKSRHSAMVSQMHEVVSRRVRAWSIIVWTIDAHLEMYRRACIFRVCSRLFAVLESRYIAKIRAFSTWRSGTLGYVQRVAGRVIYKTFWHIRLSVRGRLRFQAVDAIKSFLNWAIDGPLVVRQIRRYLERVRQVQRWWKRRVHVSFAMTALWIQQWRHAEEKLRQKHVAIKVQRRLPFHIMWNVNHQAEWSQALFRLGPNRELQAFDISTDELLVQIELGSVTWMGSSMLSEIAGGAVLQPFLHVLPHGSSVHSLLLTGQDLLQWQMKLHLALACVKILREEADPTSLTCQLRLKAVRKTHKLASHEITGVLWYFVGDMLRERPQCTPEAMHASIRANYRARRERYAVDFRKYLLARLQWRKNLLEVCSQKLQN